MIFRQFFDKKSSTYSYLLACEITKDAAIIDPVTENFREYITIIEELDLTLKYAIDTHTHADHVTALGKLREITDCVTIMGEHSEANCVSQNVSDGEMIIIGSVKLKALYTPGHTNESFSFYTQGKIFTGDALLIRGTGRTDFQGGDAGQSWDSIQEKIFSLADDTLIYPGHDYKGWTVSTVAEEKKYNSRLAGKTRDDYIEIMDGLELSDPKLMDIAIPANLQCGKE